MPLVDLRRDPQHTEVADNVWPLQMKYQPRYEVQVIPTSMMSELLCVPIIHDFTCT